eukprot:Plantae.Rhodophyta-Rhodochaete_pulchella.ctg45520.p1 GENE.Plantae.Rhodophyta-Rhodochaete_pulchella.ctg45520~~Plantae.Rhodophyta-Rhodochaete_pulchella.ctg45520.p1  ORF type:complete len:491 (-),score=49.69 Plantae.Rhodophyta-Rhodochaete_pulchella.ctg45520:3-1280(-)
MVRAEAVKAFEAILDVTCGRAGSGVDTIKMIQALETAIHKNLEPGVATPHEVIGSLSALGVLVANDCASIHLETPFFDLCRTALQFGCHQDAGIRRTVSFLLPQLARMDPEAFAQHILPAAYGFLVHEMAPMRETGNKDDLLVALGELAKSVGRFFLPYLTPTADLLRDRLSELGERISSHPCTAKKALLAISILAESASAPSEPYAEELYRLLEPLFGLVLCRSVLNTVKVITTKLPELLPSCQERLLDCTVNILHKANDPHDIVSALSIIAELDFHTFDPAVLCALLKEYVVEHLTSEDHALRRGSAQTVCRLLGAAASSSAHSHRLRRDVSVLVSDLVGFAVAETNPEIRLIVIKELSRQPTFDRYLAQPECLRRLFLCLHDAELEVKEVTVALAARLSAQNPAHSLPALRKYLMQLMVSLR